MVLIAAPSHPLAKKKVIEFEDLVRQPFVAFERDVPTRRNVDRALRTANVAVDVVMEFDNIETIKRAVEVEVGISIVPLITVQSEVRAKSLVAVPFRDRGLVRNLGILVRKGRERTQAMSKFIELLQSEEIELEF
jgi:DNA-binding transcriptional LysR family regulator